MYKNTTVLNLKNSNNRMHQIAILTFYWCQFTVFLLFLAIMAQYNYCLYILNNSKIYIHFFVKYTKKIPTAVSYQSTQNTVHFNIIYVLNAC